ncbi:MAG: alkyl hydroperoxide reductase/Thiol specific antioxidant/Mal allergen [Bacteroidetes bacterium]|nr:alkyl hydroperoxide reductase/Thiol specific antioxidant/Mal allergen [Bacteroidota bacterium]
MKYTWISALAMMLAVPGVGFSQTDSSRLQKSGVPVAGDTLTIHYNPAGGPLAGKEHIRGMVYTYRNYRWGLDDVNLQLHNGTYDAKYLVPENCAFVAFKFYVEQDGQIAAYDNNSDYGFAETTINKQGVALPGGALAWGLFRKPSFGHAPQGYFEKFNISDEALEMWIRKEMKNYPQYMPRYFGDYLAMLKMSLGDEYNEKVERNLVRLAGLPDIDESNYYQIFSTYQFELKDTHKGDSVKAVLLAKYPHGRQARHQAYTAAYNSEQNDAKLGKMEKFLQDFPVAEMRKDSGAEQQYMYYGIYRELAVGYVATGQSDKLIALLPQMDFASLVEIYRWNVERHFMTNSMPLDSIYPLGNAMMKELISKVHDGSYNENLRFTPNQADEFAMSQLDKKLAVQVRMLDKMGRYAEAMPYLRMISPAFIYTNAKLNDAHIDILEHTGNAAQAAAVLETGVSNNAATPGMIEKLKKEYVAKNGKEDGFDAYMESLKPAADVEKFRAEIKSHLISEKYTPFKLKDLNGRTVSSATDFKDKIVVIDFWAMWCTPCKSAFPGMQMVVDKYAKDKHVALYFIATQAANKNYKEEIKSYISKSGYRFNVLLDEITSKGAQDQVFRSMVSVFRSSGIPRKVVLKNGVIRWTSEGYGGSASKLVDELSYVIELLKNEN